MPGRIAVHPSPIGGITFALSATVVAVISSAALIGVDALAVDVEVERANGLPVFSIIGLGDTAVREAKYRIECALRASNIKLPKRRTTINLAPAALRKDGAALDVPMALAVLSAADVIKPECLTDVMAVGELSLSGDLRPIRGVLPIAALARRMNKKTLIVPRTNGPEARAVDGLKIVAAPTLTSLIDHLKGTAPIEEQVAADDVDKTTFKLDLAEVHGQLKARRALELAAAGGHNLLLVGPPGSGKTMLARRLPSILPTLEAEERIDVTRVWSAAGLLAGASGLLKTPPFRAPHHTISTAALIGGGSFIRPGEVSLAHRGVLFLDEMPELPRMVLEALRQPLEDRVITIARARQVITMPADFMLVGAANPCPCGWFGDRSGRCLCDESKIERYAGRLSGPLLDRIDIVVHTQTLAPGDILRSGEGESSKSVRQRVLRARLRARARGAPHNASLSGSQLRGCGQLAPSSRTVIKGALERLQLSGRGLDRTLRVARTIADLQGVEKVEGDHVLEALQYRHPAGWSKA